MRGTALAFAALLAALALSSPACAGGGNYVFDSATAKQQTVVRRALNASSFDWSVVPQQVTIHVARGLASSHAQPGHIWLDAHLLDAGRFSWAVVQDEYAHQVDFLLFDEATRAQLAKALGASVWCHAALPGLSHSAYGCERFASTLVWSYWPSAQNAYRPTTAGDESAAMAPAKFRALVSSLLGLLDGNP
jgi:hypothetical protein